MKYIPQKMTIQVKPYSLWVAYDLKNRKQVANLLPPSYHLADNVRILKDDPPYATPKLLFNAYGVDSPFMKGHRLEILTIAKNSRGAVSFVVLDVLSNTLKWDPLQGIAMANAHCSTRVEGERIFHTTRSGRRGFSVNGMLRHRTGIQSRFAVDANHRCFFRNSSLSVVMDFDRSSVMRDVRRVFPTKIENTLWSDYRGDLTHCFVHTESMKFVVDASEMVR